MRGWQAGRRLSALVVVAALGGIGAAATLGSDGSKTRNPSTRAVLVALGTQERSGEVATGFAAGPGRVVTVAHLFEAADGAPVRVRDRGGWLAARVLRRDRRADLALLEVPRLRARRVRLGSADDGGARLLLRPRNGARSGPGERPAEIRRAIVAHMRTPGGAASGRRPALELAARVSVGDSGAAVVAHAGEVVGVVFARSQRRAGTAYAVDARALRAMLEGGYPALGPDAAR